MLLWGLAEVNSTLNKTIKMHYDTQVADCTLMATAIGVSQEEICMDMELCQCLTRIDPDLQVKTSSPLN
jgi:hypothetical protein